MNLKVSGVFVTAVTIALTGAATAQNAPAFYQQHLQTNGYQTGQIAPAATSTYQTTTGQATSNAYTASTVYAPQPTGSYAPQQVETTYATAPAVNNQQAVTPYTTTTPSFASPYLPTAPTNYAAPTQTYVVPPYGSANTATYQPQPATAPTYQQPNYSDVITSQPLGAPVPAVAFTPSVPASTAPVSTGSELQDTDTWSFNLARYYPAVQACLRKSVAKNPVIANIQVRDNKTMMLIGEGGSSSFSTCSTGLTGTVVKANSDIRTLPPAFFAPIGSTFTVSPDRPFQPIVDTDQKVIGWLVRTQPSQGVNEYGQAVGFDGQFIPPMMVNTTVGKS